MFAVIAFGTVFPTSMALPDEGMWPFDGLPLHADDLSSLPPAWITTCGADPLRDDGRAYADRLREAGVAVQHRHLAGHVHPSFAFTRIASAATHERDAITALRTALHPGPVRAS